VEKPVVVPRPALFDGSRRYFLSASGSTMIGRQGCAILLSDTEVAPQHARFMAHRSGFTVEGVGGEVFVNDQLISSPALLRTGDTLRIGNTCLTFEGPDQAETPPIQQLSYEELFEKLKGSVVGIRTSDGLGSGFFVQKEGLLITNRHVVGYERSVNVYLFDGRQLPGRVVRSFPEIDLAFVRVEGVAPYIPPSAPAGMTRPGQAVLVIGHPMGLANTLTRGIISAINREVMGNIYLQTDAAINPGNSGGPLFNDLGEIIGVATMGLGNTQGLNFAIPWNIVQQRMEKVLFEESRVAKGQGIYCIVCGIFSVGGNYCPNCGVSFIDIQPKNGAQAPAAPTSCTNCGKSLNSGDMFCPGCGTRV
jgi:S1-C subfamily serine protease